MTITCKKINDIEVKKVNLPKTNPEDIKGYKMIPELYSNIYLCAKKNSGKTTVLFNILKNCINKFTHVYFFVSTLYRDDTYKKIIDWLDSKDIGHTDHLSLYDGRNDILAVILNELYNQADLDEEKHIKADELDKLYGKIINYSETDTEIKIVIKKPKKKTPEVCFVFDDLSGEIRTSQSLRRLLKMNRHIKSKTIVSSQYVSE